jgi:guanine deaminase
MAEKQYDPTISWPKDSTRQMPKKSTSHEKFMRRAIELSLENVTKGRGGPFGAVIVKDDKILAEGVNLVTATNDPTAHAEVSAIREACKNLSTFDLSGAEIYTSCEPCPMCLSAIYWARISKIYFANTKKDAAKIEFDDNFIYEEIPKEPKSRKIAMKQLLREEALKVFTAWEKSLNKIHY